MRYLASAFAAVLCAVPVRAEGWKGDVNLLVAGKHLAYRDWAPTEHQGELGIQTNWQGPDWPIALAADLLVSGAKEPIDSRGFTEQRGSTSELDLGVRKIFEATESFRPYLGGGIALASGALEFRGPFREATDHDGGAGLWLGGGVSWLLGKSFNLGLDAKLSHAAIRLFGDEKSAGGVHLGLLVGYHWGS